MSLTKYLRKQTFDPGIVGLFINPFFFSRRDLQKHIKTCAIAIEGKTLDVGCGKKPYKGLFKNVTEYVGMDIENSGHDHSNEDIDVYYDGKIFPFPDHSFDSVITNQVFEHVFNPEDFMKEITRVLKPGGHLLLTVPFAWDEHEQPYDFARYSSFGISHILQSNGFQVKTFIKSTKGFKAITQLFIVYIYKLFYSKNKTLNLIGTVLLLSPLTIIGSVLSIIAPPSKDFYLDNIVLAVKLK
jgi:SAM-dependent methyltransferase